MNRTEIIKDIVSFEKSLKDLIIIHFSDIHFNKNTKVKKLNKIVDETKKNNPDYIMITGDLIDYPDIIKDKVKIKDFINFLIELGNICPVFISIGNHDVLSVSDLKFFDKLNDIANINVLNNSSYQDNYIYVSGFTLPNNYYYNINGYESSDIMLEHLKNNGKLLHHLPTSKVKIGLIHSPINLVNDTILKELGEYNLLLSGHMHNGMVPSFLKIFFKKNAGIISPSNKLFPKICRGTVEKNIKGNKITLIISGGITKLSLKSSNLLSKLNFVYSMSINKIIITKRKGKYYE